MVSTVIARRRRAARSPGFRWATVPPVPILDSTVPPASRCGVRGSLPALLATVAASLMGLLMRLLVGGRVGMLALWAVMALVAAAFPRRPRYRPSKYATTVRAISPMRSSASP
jgi:hypothetical protein